MRKDIKPRDVFVPSDAPQPLHQALDIPQERFDKVIKPFITAVFAEGGKVADAILKVADNEDLTEMEELYCVFEISKVCAYRDVKNQIKTKGIAAGVPGYQINQMFGGYEDLR